MRVAASKDSKDSGRTRNWQEIMAIISITYYNDEYDSHSFLLQSNLTAFSTPTTWTMILRHPILSLVTKHET